MSPNFFVVEVCDVIMHFNSVTIG